MNFCSLSLSLLFLVYFVAARKKGISEIRITDNTRGIHMGRRVSPVNREFTCPVNFNRFKHAGGGNTRQEYHRRMKRCGQLLQSLKKQSKDDHLRELLQTRQNRKSIQKLLVPHRRIGNQVTTWRENSGHPRTAAEDENTATNPTHMQVGLTQSLFHANTSTSENVQVDKHLNNENEEGNGHNNSDSHIFVTSMSSLFPQNVDYVTSNSQSSVDSSSQVTGSPYFPAAQINETVSTSTSTFNASTSPILKNYSPNRKEHYRGRVGLRHSVKNNARNTTRIPNIFKQLKTTMEGGLLNETKSDTHFYYVEELSRSSDQDQTSVEQNSNQKDSNQQQTFSPEYDGNQGVSITEVDEDENTSDTTEPFLIKTSPNYTTDHFLVLPNMQTKLEDTDSRSDLKGEIFPENSTTTEQFLKDKKIADMIKEVRDSYAKPSESWVALFLNESGKLNHKFDRSAEETISVSPVVLEEQSPDEYLIATITGEPATEGYVEGQATTSIIFPLNQTLIQKPTTLISTPNQSSASESFSGQLKNIVAIDEPGNHQSTPSTAHPSRQSSQVQPTTLSDIPAHVVQSVPATTISYEQLPVPTVQSSSKFQQKSTQPATTSSQLKTPPIIVGKFQHQSTQPATISSQSTRAPISELSLTPIQPTLPNIPVHIVPLAPTSTISSQLLLMPTEQPSNNVENAQSKILLTPAVKPATNNSSSINTEHLEETISEPMLETSDIPQSAPSDSELVGLNNEGYYSFSSLRNIEISTAPPVPISQTITSEVFPETATGETNHKEQHSSKIEGAQFIVDSTTNPPSINTMRSIYEPIDDDETEILTYDVPDEIEIIEPPIVIPVPDQVIESNVDNTLEDVIIQDNIVNSDITLIPGKPVDLNTMKKYVQGHMVPLNEFEKITVIPNEVQLIDKPIIIENDNLFINLQDGLEVVGGRKQATTRPTLEANNTYQTSQTDKLMDDSQENLNQNNSFQSSQKTDTHGNDKEERVAAKDLLTLSHSLHKHGERSFNIGSTELKQHENLTHITSPSIFEQHPHYHEEQSNNKHHLNKVAILHSITKSNLHQSPPPDSLDAIPTTSSPPVSHLLLSTTTEGTLEAKHWQKTNLRNRETRKSELPLPMNPNDNWKLASVYTNNFHSNSAPTLSNHVRYSNSKQQNPVDIISLPKLHYHHSRKDLGFKSSKNITIENTPLESTSPTTSSSLNRSYTETTIGDLSTSHYNSLITGHNENVSTSTLKLATHENVAAGASFSLNSTPPFNSTSLNATESGDEVERHAESNVLTNLPSNFVSSLQWAKHPSLSSQNRKCNISTSHSTLINDSIVPAVSDTYKSSIAGERVQQSAYQPKPCQNIFIIGENDADTLEAILSLLNPHSVAKWPKKHTQLRTANSVGKTFIDHNEETPTIFKKSHTPNIASTGPLYSTMQQHEDPITQSLKHRFDFVEPKVLNDFTNVYGRYVPQKVQTNPYLKKSAGKGKSENLLRSSIEDPLIRTLRELIRLRSSIPKALVNKGARQQGRS